jgi:hypothetical protein
MGKSGSHSTKCRWCHRRLIFTPDNPIPQELSWGWFELVDTGLPVASPVFFCSNDCFRNYYLHGRDELAEYLNRHPPITVPGVSYGWKLEPVLTMRGSLGKEKGDSSEKDLPGRK